MEVTAIDDDGIRSTRTFPVLVQMGAPRIWIDGNTLFVPTPAIGGRIDIPVNSTDTNGIIINVITITDKAGLINHFFKNCVFVTVSR